jgi:hypothetical protein
MEKLKECDIRVVILRLNNVTNFRFNLFQDGLSIFWRAVVYNLAE